MNIKTLLSVAFVGALVLSSCKNEEADAQQTMDETSVEMPATNTPEPMESEIQTPTPETTQEAPAMLQQNATPAPATSQRLNPAHGMPNHRCDIEVGAPLPM